jgi:hypothetical protein
MLQKLRYSFCSIPLVLLAFSTAGATSVPSLSFEELTDHSELIVSGRITRSWSDWDSEHKFIWTHHELTVSASHKGAGRPTVVVSEPGGVVGDRAMTIAGTVAYRPGDQVTVFLQRMPNGYLRTTGWGQGKYTLDKAGLLHVDSAIRGIEVVTVDRGVTLNTAQNTPLRALDGMSLAELRLRVAARVQAQRQGGTK